MHHIDTATQRMDAFGYDPAGVLVLIRPGVAERSISPLAGRPTTSAEGYRE
jgi:hypothetical protein